MKNALTILFVTSVAACGSGIELPQEDTDNDTPEDILSGACDPATDETVASGTMAVLTLSDSGSIDKFSISSHKDIQKNLVAASTDAALRKFGGLPIILNRGIAGNVHRLDANFKTLDQIAIPGCNPQDIIALDPCRALITCYATNVMKVLHWDTGAIVDGPDLSTFADSDGIVEMHQMVITGTLLLVSLQRLDQFAGFLPSNPSMLAVLDRDTLEVIDMHPGTPEPAGIELPCRNPFTQLHVLADGRVGAGCAGAFFEESPESAIVAVNQSTGATEVLANQNTLGGKLTAFAPLPDGSLVALVAVPNAGDYFTTDRMEVVHLAASGAKVVYSAASFSLSGLAVTSDGSIYVGNRRPDGDAGVWTIAVGPPVNTIGPIQTGLPPFELVHF